MASSQPIPPSQTSPVVPQIVGRPTAEDFHNAQPVVFDFLSGAFMTGIPAARVLGALQRELPEPLATYLGPHGRVSGTSMGAVLATAVATGFPAEEMEAKLLEAAPQIFPTSGRVWPWQQCYKPVFREEGRERVLGAWLNGTGQPLRMGDVQVPLTIFDLTLFTDAARPPRAGQYDSTAEDCRDRPLMQPLLRSTAIPGVLPVDASADKIHCDGGSVAGSAALGGIANTVRHAPAWARPCVPRLVQFGATHGIETPRSATGWGFPHWCYHLFNLGFRAEPSHKFRCLSEMLSAQRGDQAAWSLVVPLTPNDDYLEARTPEVQASLLSQTDAYLTSPVGRESLGEVVEMLHVHLAARRKVEAWVASQAALDTAA